MVTVVFDNRFLNVWFNRSFLEIWSLFNTQKRSKMESHRSDTILESGRCKIKYACIYQVTLELAPKTNRKSHTKTSVWGVITTHWRGKLPASPRWFLNSTLRSWCTCRTKSSPQERSFLSQSHLHWFMLFVHHQRDKFQSSWKVSHWMLPEAAIGDRWATVIEHPLLVWHVGQPWSSALRYMIVVVVVRHGNQLSPPGNHSARACRRCA